VRLPRQNRCCKNCSLGGQTEPDKNQTVTLTKYEISESYFVILSVSPAFKHPPIFKPQLRIAFWLLTQKSVEITMLVRTAGNGQSGCKFAFAPILRGPKNEGLGPQGNGMALAVSNR
jgi:hypothetical protein